MNIITIIKSPKLVQNLDNKNWELVISQAKSSGLLGRLYYIFKQQNLLTYIPDSVIWHLESDYTISKHLRISCRREFFEITQALSNKNITPIFLKGAMYALRELPVCFGRRFSDIDVLVNKTEIEDAERELYFQGWFPQKKIDYDDKYYRQWMHEIPPLQHAKRRTVLDLHHNILPLTNKNHLPFEAFNIQCSSVENLGNIYSLSDLDIVIHSAVHLFTESDFTNPLRDLSDLDILIRYYSQREKDFVINLITRAKELNLWEYIRLALRYTHLIFDTPTGNIKSLKLDSKNWVQAQVQDFCFINIFKPNHSSCNTWKTKFAIFLLYWRGHLLRMPLRLLIPHLTRKSWMALKDTFTKEKEPNENMIP
ncbi:nucleotidyltransferase domain-containing protein [Thalassotalea agariperforans]